MTDIGGGAVSAGLDEGPLIELAMDPKAARPPESPSPGRRRRRMWPGVLGAYVGMIAAIITLNFFLPRFMPGDPITALVSRGSSTFVYGEASKTKLKEFYGLNGSLPSQFGHYLNRLAHGDLGRSISTNQSVVHDVAKAIPWTLLLITTSMLLSAGIGLVLGVHAGWRRDKPADRVLMTGLLSAREFPQYLLGSMLLFFFAVKLGWLPIGGAETAFSSDFSLWHRITDIARHAALPIIVLTAGLTVSYYLVMRSGMVDELGSDYLMLGRAKGLRNRRLKYRYAARNALVPVLSLTAVEIGFAVTANIIIEQVFSYPGLGGLLLGSVASRDYPTMQGAFLVLSVGIVTVNAIADLTYRRFDPRATG